MSVLLDAARQWAAMGIPVFPVRGKIPRTGHGVKDATTDEARIEAWWGEAPNAGIGGATGAPCGSWVLDVDGDTGRASLAELEATHGNLPETLTCRTGGGGEHRWFQMPEDRAVGNRAGFRPCLDVRGTGGYVVLPPSPHPSGQRYEIVVDAPIAPAPPWLLDLVAPPKRRGTVVPLERARIAGIVRAAAERIRAAPEGERNDTVNRECYAVGGFLRAAGLLPEDVEAELLAAAETADQPAETASRALRDGYDAPRPLPPDRSPNRPPTAADLLPAHQPDPEVRQDPDLQVRVTEDGDSVVKASLPNAVLILDRDRRWVGRIRWCLFRGRLEVDAAPVTDAQEGELVVWVARAYGCTLTTRIIHEALVTVAARHPWHPVRGYLLGLRWDGVARIDSWLTRYAGVGADPIGYGARFLISAVARILQPGCQVDQVLVLADPHQGRGKTALVRVLAGLDWSSDSALRIGDKDAYQQLQGVWIYELSELSALRKADIEAVKGFVTARVDKFRPPYGRNVIEVHRQCVFLGSTNEGRPLTEGGRRWWVVHLNHDADLVALARDRDQLWAEAVHRQVAGEPWHLVGVQAQAQREDAEQYVQQDPWAPSVADFLGQHPVVTTAHVLTHIGVALSDRTRADEVRVGRILEQLGWRGRKCTHDGVRAWWWFRV